MARKKAKFPSYTFRVVQLWADQSRQGELAASAHAHLKLMNSTGWELVSVAPDPEDQNYALFTWRTLGNALTVLLLLALARPAIAQLPDAPQPQPRQERHRVADRSYWLVRAEHATALGLDIGSSIAGQHKGCFEDSPIFGTAHPKPWMFAAYGAGEWTAVAGFDYWLKRHMQRRGVRSRFWQVPMHFFSAAHVFAFALNEQNGCGL